MVIFSIYRVCNLSSIVPTRIGRVTFYVFLWIDDETISDKHLFLSAPKLLSQLSWENDKMSIWKTNDPSRKNENCTYSIAILKTINGHHVPLSYIPFPTKKGYVTSLYRFQDHDGICKFSFSREGSLVFQIDILSFSQHNWDKSLVQIKTSVRLISFRHQFTKIHKKLLILFRKGLWKTSYTPYSRELLVQFGPCWIAEMQV